MVLCQVPFQLFRDSGLLIIFSPVYAPFVSLYSFLPITSIFYLKRQSCLGSIYSISSGTVSSYLLSHSLSLLAHVPLTPQPTKIQNPASVSTIPLKLVPLVDQYFHITHVHGTKEEALKQVASSGSTDAC